MRFKRKEKEVSPMQKTLKEQEEVPNNEDDDIQSKSVHLYDISTGFNVDYEALPNKQREEDDVISDISYIKMTEALEEHKDMITELINSKRVDKYQKENFYKFNGIISELYEDFDMVEILTKLIAMFDLDIAESNIITSFMLESNRHILRQELEHKFRISNKREIGLLRFF